MNEETMEVDPIELGLVPRVDDTNTSFSDLSPSERFVKVLDQIDAKVESLRKDAMKLQADAEVLHLSIELLRNHEHLNNLDDCEREEIDCYVQRIGGRLSTVELSVRTVRDQAQEESLHLVNRHIEELLLSNCDPVITRQRCQQYLNACHDGTFDEHLHPPDKKFECALLGCTIDDQKHIKRRLLALLDYLTKQSVTA